MCQHGAVRCNQSSALIIDFLSGNCVKHTNVIANDKMNADYDKHKVEYF